MKIKNYKCICGSTDFLLEHSGPHYGIYCTYCGRWYKWADKNEVGLFYRYYRRVANEDN